MLEPRAHAPQPLAGYHPNEITLLEGIENQFLRLDKTYPEADEPVHERWFRILETFPDVRHKHLWDDVTEALTKIYNSGSGNEIAGAVDYVCLRLRFFELLKLNNMGLAHVNDYEIESAIIWKTKLFDRAYDTDPPDFDKDDKFVPARTKHKTKHLWLQ